MVCYSTDGKAGFLTKEGIAQIKSGLAKEIFRQDLTEIYQRQTERRDALTRESQNVLQRLIEQMRDGTLENPKIEQLMLELKFGRIVYTTPEKHDQTIAFTSQLAHVVSSAYIKSPTVKEESGFSAGSFRDLTRVAKLNEDMWTELFLMNRPALLYEIDTIMAALAEYRDALADGDGERMRSLLRDGRILKEWSLQHSITE